MFPTTYLEWFHNGEWHRIGWPASTPESTERLHQHGEAMAGSHLGEKYRLVQPSVNAGEDVTVMHVYDVRTIEDFRWDVLSEIVHEIASEIASGVNNGGESAQMEYLLSNGWTREQIDARLIEAER